MREVIMAPLILLLILPGRSAPQPGNLPDSRPIGEIEFFGYKGLDVARIRAGLGFREGDLLRFPPQNRDDDPSLRINESIRETLGRVATDVSVTCCDGRQLLIIYIGLPGSSSRAVTLNRTPAGPARVTADIMRLNDQLSDALMKAVLRGNAAEDRSQGFALNADPDAGAIQLKLRSYALGHERDIMRVLATSADAGHRQAAAMTLGYARGSVPQVNTLVDACFDVDGIVRNNAARALDVLFEARGDLAKRVRIDRFLPLLTSGKWTDHNKVVHLVEILTRGRNAEVFASIRAGALENLVEMARWRSEHAWDARLVLGRVAGVDEARLREWVHQGRIGEIISAALAH